MDILLKEQSPEEGCALFETHMARDFPASEIKPWDVILGLVESGSYDMLAAYDGDRMVGYAWMFCPKGEAVLLDYLAVLPEYRGTGVGSRILDALAERYCVDGRAFLLESEYPDTAPEPEVARRRLGFYARAGFRNTGVQVLLFGVRFCVLSRGTDDRGRAHMEWIYRKMFPGERYQQAVRFLDGQPEGEQIKR